MAASRYRRFLRLCEEWPVEETKQQRDLGSFLRQKVAQAFREGENTPRVSFLCLPAYLLLAHLCLPSPFADILRQMEDRKKGTWKRLREKFSAKKPEEG
uniref:Mitochondrial nucleoid factor 1 n=1 Tax=Junco hyemalis TaxID=40217 RepID=A0A8C5JRU5_JUNHY